MISLFQVISKQRKNKNTVCKTKNFVFPGDHTLLIFKEYIARQLMFDPKIKNQIYRLILLCAAFITEPLHSQMLFLLLVCNDIIRSLTDQFFQESFCGN